MADFKKRGPTYDEALSWLGNIPGALVLMLPTGLTATLRQEMEGCDGLRLGWGAVADGTVMALLHRGTADGCRLYALMSHLTRRHIHVTTSVAHLSHVFAL